MFQESRVIAHARALPFTTDLVYDTGVTSFVFYRLKPSTLFAPRFLSRFRGGDGNF